MTKDYSKQRSFEEELSRLVDDYLGEGLDPELLDEVLNNELSYDHKARKKDIDSDQKIEAEIEDEKERAKWDRVWDKP